MKRIVPMLLALLLLAGCATGPKVKSPQTTPEPAPAGTVQAQCPFLTYSFYDQPNWDDLMEDVMFQADLDQDGVAEPVSFSLDHEGWNADITWGESTVRLDLGDDLVKAAVLDLDPESPFYNLLVVLDYGSDSYVTVELHPENGQLTKGPVVEGGWSWRDDALWFYERTDLLGTDSGERTYSGDGLVPDSDWLTMSYIPTVQDIKEEWEYLVDGGVLLHTVLPVPCTVKGQPYTIPSDSYVYRLRFKDTGDTAEVALLDGTVALISCTVEEGGWPYLIDGQEIENYFDNLCFAD